MSFAHQFERVFRWLLPSPFAIAIILTLITVVLALFFGQSPAGSQLSLWESLQYWQEGLWNGPLLIFMVQMMLILVLGHTLALAPPVNAFINHILKLSRNPARASALVCFFTLAVAFFNWGLGLIFGAILARKTGEQLSAQGQKFNYALVGAAGYSGLMVWHGGLSGSAPVKVGELGHLKEMVRNNLSAEFLSAVPDRLGFEATVFSPMNIMASLMLLVALPLLTYFLARKVPGRPHSFTAVKAPKTEENKSAFGAEKIDQSLIWGLATGITFLSVALAIAWQSEGLNFINPNYINFVLLGLGLSFHGNFKAFTGAVDQAIGGAAGILIQFPLYFGIMGIMSNSGMIAQLSSFFSEISNAQSFPIFTFFSAGLINIFVPSGGGQWAIQGPVLIQTAQTLGTPLNKAIMALSYGDQITNMLQPFWALPLLGITELKAREIIPYTLAFMAVGIIIFIGVLLLF